ncbi:UNVERIFIED_CONTAM: hypothetical protein Sradi_5321700 [Sesamum radiatum]|uniref:Uncharacterized protein n=1 Tax=Sesamum radiatum TaxID=300843 RepID=A0AAW2LP93_SESRA
MGRRKRESKPGMLVVDEDPVWQKPVKEEQDSSDEKSLKLMKILKSSVWEDWSNWGLDALLVPFLRMEVAGFLCLMLLIT